MAGHFCHFDRAFHYFRLHWPVEGKQGKRHASALCSSAGVQPHGVRVQAFEERHLCSLRLYCRPVDGAAVSFGEQMGSASTPTRLLPRLWRLPGRGRTVASKCEGRCRRGRARAGEPQHLHRRVSWRARAVGREQGEPSLTHRRASGRASRRYRHFPSWGRRCGASVAEGGALAEA